MSEMMMLDAVLRMPPSLWSGDELDIIQRHGRYIEAANELQALRAELEQLRDDIQKAAELLEDTIAARASVGWGNA